MPDQDGTSESARLSSLVMTSAPELSGNATLADKLKAVRQSLLDLTTRNRLISTPRKSKSTRQIEIVDATGSQIYRELVTENRSVGFAPKEKETDDAGLPLGEIEPTPESRGILRLKTNLTADALRNRLLGLYLDAKTFEEEQGVGILYVAIGFLKWYEASNSEVERYAPLLLVPINLERGSIKARFRVRWTEEDPAPNLSLNAMLRQEHHVTLPEWDDAEDFDPDRYLDEVAAAIADQPRWVVQRDDVTVGFFSFAKFLMYRDLDSENWPEHAAIDQHSLISGLFGEGFSIPDNLLPKDSDFDKLLPSATTLHVVDADSSQAAVIEEVRRGHNLVVQGPPGTGKSQTIANVIAAAVAGGKRVLFVAEKMAALEVVKRRLDNVGIGEMCLELHSRKTNKRAVVQELNRVWRLGPPNGATAFETNAFDALRQRLNACPAQLHATHEPGKLSPYQVIGHLVRLARKGVNPSNITLPSAASWTPTNREQCRRELTELVARTEAIGLPSRHPWRGACVATLIPTDLHRLQTRISSLRKKFKDIESGGAELQRKLVLNYPLSLSGIIALAKVAAAVGAVPTCDSKAITSDSWIARRGDIEALLEAGETYSSTRAALAGIVSESALTTDVTAIRQILILHGTSWLRWFMRDWRQANTMLRALFVANPPKGVSDRLAVLDRLILAQKSSALLVRDNLIGRDAFGDYWQSDRSNWDLLGAVQRWVLQVETAGIGKDARNVVGRIHNPDATKTLAITLDRLTNEAIDEIRAICDVVELKIEDAFAASRIEEVTLAELVERFGSWGTATEDLPKWIAYRAQAVLVRDLGLGEFAARLADGRLPPPLAVDEFDMVYYEAVFRAMAQTEPGIATFDGEIHSRHIENFKRLDIHRIDVSRLQVAAAHHQGLPARHGLGPIAVLRTEIAKQRKLLPIRQLIKRAGPAIQAIKPVFMMSPLSIAQFLEPGAISFDILVIDEASQVRPVEALGAIARCQQIVVVGDERQLPPTAFFSKLSADDDDDEEESEDNAAVQRVGDVESILGLCSASGMPERMLKWHYRSRHESLIAVSNREFYESELFIVPSPNVDDSDLGLRFHHLPSGTFDIGGSRTNRIEAIAVAARVLEHARQHPDLSLGVAAFSAAQRRAIMDELELLRRGSDQTEEFFTSNHPAEPFFVKNLENVQGDERDVIFISVGYGRNQQGRMLMRFPTLGSDGGERRLNVLITRARRRCEVFSSITDEDIDLERARGKGVSALKTFLRYARTGDLDVARPTDRDFDSVFEAQVAAALTDNGYIVKSQVGQSGFFIDLAVVDPKRPGRYIIGIECDGAAYHSTRFARDRDRLRQAVLEDHGWTIHRIWSTDWFKRPEAQLQATIAAIEKARANPDVEVPTSMTPPASTKNPVEIARVPLGETEPEGDPPSISAPYNEAHFTVDKRLDIHQAPLPYLSEIVLRILQIEGPIHRDEIVNRIRQLWGQQRAGSRIHSAVTRALQYTKRHHTALVHEGPFYFFPDRPVKIRDRSNAASSSLRRPEMLPPVEMRAATIAIVDANFGADREEAITAVSRGLGFRSTSSQLHAIIDEQITNLVQSGELLENERRLSRPDR